MPATNFRFVSPGVYTNEIDNSRLPRLPARMGPVIIGRSMQGPLMKPVQIQSFADFVDVFGAPVPGGIGGDVWRNGNHTAPTYGAYAAQAYLRNANPVTFIRLGGYQHEEAVDDGYAGWDLGGDAYGLFVAPLTGSDDIYTIGGDLTGTLAAIVYTTLNGNTKVGLSGPELSGSTSVHKQTGVWIRSTGADAEFKLVVGDVSASVNFNESSKKYIRNVLNVNPILTNTNLIKEENQETYFLGESYATAIKKINGGSLGTGANQLAGVLVKLGASGFADYANHKKPATHAETGWIVSQHKGVPTDFKADAVSGLYPVQKLFKLISLSEGEWNSQNLKVTIEDIREPSNNYVKFGSFSVSVRKLDDSDSAPVYLERFTNLSLDINSENYIAKRIGDKYRTWDYKKKEFAEYGTYDNASKFIRVEMDEDAAAGLNDPDLLPFGFYGPVTYKAVSGVDEIVADRFIGANITGSSAFQVSLELPVAKANVSLLTSVTDSIASSFNGVFWGLKTSILATKKHNYDSGDLLKDNPYNFPVDVDADTKYAYFFSLDDVSGAISDKGTLVETSGATWQEGNRMNELSVTYQTYDLGITGSRGDSVILSKFNKFTLPLHGGSDGVDITEKDPFNKRVLTSDSSEFTNYAYNSIKVAIESIADPEVVEMNLACVPGVVNEDLTNLLMEKCEARADALAIIDLDGDYVPDEGKANATQKVSERKPNVDNVILNLKNRNLNTSYGCSFFPWVMIQDRLSNNSVWVPPSVVALGTFAFSERVSELWFAPAGFNRGGLSNGAGGLTVLQTALKINSKDRDALYEANINPIASFPAEGIVIFGQKTLQVTPSALDRINVRRLMIYLKKEISRFATTVLFDPNVEVTWKRFTSVAEPFLESVKVRFGLSDYRLILDGSTTTPDLVDRNIVYAKIMLKPTRSIEFIGLDFVITNTGASFDD